jgi:hypothetical protein
LIFNEMMMQSTLRLYDFDMYNNIGPCDGT